MCFQMFSHGERLKRNTLKCKILLTKGQANLGADTSHSMIPESCCAAIHSDLDEVLG